LLNERASLAQAIGHAKTAIKYRPERESAGSAPCERRNAGPLSATSLTRLYTEIMSACRALEDAITVAYLGPPGNI
jgi:chorismate mutase/prephenate dehydratase